MTAQKLTTHRPFRLFLKQLADRPRPSAATARAKDQNLKDAEPFPPETDPKILIEHYAHLGRGPMLAGIQD